MRSRFGIQRRRRFVAQKDPWLHREAARQAEPLLLTDGELRGRRVEPIPDLLPQAHQPQIVLDRLIEAASFAQPVDARPKAHVLVDGHRQRVGPLREHTHLLAHLGDVHLWVEH
jgi:hypothetical protein